MKLFLDTEFTGLHQKTTLISIAIVSENNSFFYAELVDYDPCQVGDWIKENVIEHLILEEVGIQRLDNQSILLKGTQKEIYQELLLWLAQFQNITIIGDVYMYDWILFCELFGNALNIPSNISYIPIDFATLLWAKGYDPKIDREELVNMSLLEKHLNILDFKLTKHNALYDTFLLKSCFECLKI